MNKIKCVWQKIKNNTHTHKRIKNIASPSKNGKSYRKREEQQKLVSHTNNTFISWEYEEDIV